MNAIAEGQTQSGLGGAAPARRAIRFPVARAAKIAGALSVLALGAYALNAEAGFIASDNAVVSAHSLTIRTPIDGYARGLALHVGAAVGRGDVLARVSNPRVDDQRLAELREQVARFEAELAAARAAREELHRLHAGLQDRVRDHTDAVGARYLNAVAEADRALEALVARREQARRDLGRRAALGASGAVAPAEIERARLLHDVAAREVEAGVARAASLRAEAFAAARGVMSSPGTNDVTYSAQRADEVELRLADVNRSLALSAAALEEARVRLAAEERRVGLLREAEVPAPAAGMVWKLGATEGERLATGEAVAQLVDCGAAFVLATVPQSVFSRIEIGSTAEFRLSGESVRRTGQVLSVTGETTPDRTLAAMPPERVGANALVRVTVPPSANTSGECLVGRTARVLLPAAGGGLLDRALRFF